MLFSFALYVHFSPNKEASGHHQESRMCFFRAHQITKDYLSASLRAYHYVANKLIHLAAKASMFYTKKKHCIFIDTLLIVFMSRTHMNVIFSKAQQATTLL